MRGQPALTRTAWRGRSMVAPYLPSEDKPETAMIIRCSWAEGDTLLRAYHDEEWGVPERNSRKLWEILMLEGFQAGLSWTIILRKREAFRKAFKNFDPELVSRFRKADVARLLV